MKSERADCRSSLGQRRVVYSRPRQSFPVNPFATCYVQPGALPWLADSPTAVSELADRFQGPLQSRAAIVGPHGSGKSTLLHQLAPCLGQVGWYQTPDGSDAMSVRPGGRVVWHVLRRHEQPLQQIVRSRAAWRPAGVLVVDGLEQLRSWEYVGLRAVLTYARMGLLTTCHRPCRTLATLCFTTVTSGRLQHLVTRLISAQARPRTAQLSALADENLLQRLLQQERGNVREVLMRLYDLAEKPLANSANGRTARRTSSTIQSA